MRHSTTIILYQLLTTTFGFISEMLIAVLLLILSPTSVKPRVFRGYYVPKEEYPQTETFDYQNGSKLLIVNKPVTWSDAEVLCREVYNSQLVVFTHSNILKFVNEVMPESDFELDSLWIGLRRYTDLFQWLNVNITVPNEQFEKCGNNSAAYAHPEDMNCAAVIRRFHDESCFVKLNCRAKRGFMCFGDSDTEDMRGWIKIGKRYYKIFYDAQPYKRAQRRCVVHDKEASLAVIVKLRHAKLLTRYLLIGRPSLERAWVGASWQKEHYMWEAEKKPLPNITQPDGYPPWRHQMMRKPGQCLLLDRHVSNITYFVETLCNKSYPYICYKTVLPPEPEICYTDGRHDYKVFLNKSSWHRAYEECATYAPTGRLAVVEREDMKYFVFIMESYKLYLLHAWLGAQYKNHSWVWRYTNKTLPAVAEAGYPPWVVNRTYFKSIESLYICLNIDRENSIIAMFYGTACEYPQPFICQFDLGTICNSSFTTTTEPDPPMTSAGSEETTATTKWINTSLTTVPYRG